MEEERAAKKAAEAERLKQYREERAAFYAKQEEEAIARGDFETVVIEEYRCDICKKVFKKEAQLDNHLKSKKHKDAEAKLRAHVEFDSDTEARIQEEDRKRKEEIERI